MSGPRRKQDFHPEDLALATSLCLDVATRLGDFLDDMVVIGGLVPSLLVGTPAPQLSIEAHVGTTDVDLGLTIRVLTAERYKTIAERLRHTGFEPDRTADGRIVRQRWRLAEHPRVTMDFLIAPANPQATGGTLQSFLPDFGLIAF